MVPDQFTANAATLAQEAHRPGTMKLIIWIAIGAACGLATIAWILGGAGAEHPTPAQALSTGNGSAPIASTGRIPARIVEPLALPPPPILKVLVNFAGAYTPAEQPLALTSGSRFNLEICGNRNGTVTVQATNPDGFKDTVWHGRVVAGRCQALPNMALEGKRGTELLKVIYQADHTAQSSYPAPVVRTVRFLHV